MTPLTTGTQRENSKKYETFPYTTTLENGKAQLSQALNYNNVYPLGAKREIFKFEFYILRFPFCVGIGGGWVGGRSKFLRSITLKLFHFTPNEVLLSLGSSI